GVRSGMMVALAVPFSFLFSFIVISMLGFTYNFMVIFALLLGRGILIDGAIVRVEFADTKMSEGCSPRDAYTEAVNRMFWPILASTGTTLMVFLPMMFWPGVAGEFMRYLPITVFAVLCGSLLYALWFAPVLGALFARAPKVSTGVAQLRHDELDLKEVTGANRLYAHILNTAVHAPGIVFVGSICTLVAIVVAYFNFGKGVEFFTAVEPNQTRVE